MQKLILVLILLISQNAFSQKSKLATNLRLYVGSQNFDLTEANQNLKNQNFDQIESLPILGLEASAYATSSIQLGVRGHIKSKIAKSTDGVANDSAQLTQSSFSVIARLDLLDSNLFFIDANIGVGLANSELEVNKTLIKSTYKDESHFIGNAGLSAGVGWKSFFIFGEAGYENNESASLEKSVNAPDTYKKLELSGPYFLLGISLRGLNF